MLQSNKSPKFWKKFKFDNYGEEYIFGIIITIPICILYFKSLF